MHFVLRMAKCVHTNKPTFNYYPFFATFFSLKLTHKMTVVLERGLIFIRMRIVYHSQNYTHKGREPKNVRNENSVETRIFRP